VKRSGQIVFLVAAVAALVLYVPTSSAGLPWNQSTHLALAYLGDILPFSEMPYPLWGCCVRLFGGPVALSVTLAALAAGVLAALVNRYFGVRVALSAALTWIFLPAVWNRVIAGHRSVSLVAAAVVAAWLLNVFLLRLTRRVRLARRLTRMNAPAAATGEVLGAPTSHRESEVRKAAARWFRRLSMGVAAGVAIVSATSHDYRFGEAASAYAEGVVASAGDRVIVLNGVCDDQIVRAIGKAGGAGRGCAPAWTGSVVFLRNDEVYRTNLTAWVRCRFPAETNLWAAAQVGPSVFVAAATQECPERFWLMNGKSETLAGWSNRWEAFQPYLDSYDPFVRVARRLFAQEANGVANTLLDARDDAATSRIAWKLYRRIYETVDPGNFSALVNMSEMARRGYKVSRDERKWVQDRLEAFVGRSDNRRRMREIARAAGPVRMEAERIEGLAEEVRRGLVAKISTGEKVECPAEILSLVEWTQEMFALMNTGDVVRAGCIARAILSNPDWRECVPANAVMGTVVASEGDYAASERFFQVAIGVTNRVSPVVFNDYADALMHLGRLDEAEAMARRAIDESEGKCRVARVTLAQIEQKKAAKGACRVTADASKVKPGAGGTSKRKHDTFVARNLRVLSDSPRFGRLVVVLFRYALPVILFFGFVIWLALHERRHDVRSLKTGDEQSAHEDGEWKPDVTSGVFDGWEVRPLSGEGPRASAEESGGASSAAEPHPEGDRQPSEDESGEALFARARALPHQPIPDYGFDREYLELLGRSAAASHAPAQVKLGEYAMRRGAWVEAYYWMTQAKQNGMKKMTPVLREIRMNWARDGFRDEIENVHPLFSAELGAVGRKLLRRDSRGKE